MSKTLTATDRKNLIRLASSLPSGDKSRRTILAGLKKVAEEGAVSEYELRMLAPSKVPAGAGHGPGEFGRKIEKDGFGFLGLPYKVTVESDPNHSTDSLYVMDPSKVEDFKKRFVKWNRARLKAIKDTEKATKNKISKAFGFPVKNMGATNLPIPGGKSQEYFNRYTVDTGIPGVKLYVLSYEDRFYFAELRVDAAKRIDLGPDLSKAKDVINIISPLANFSNL
mgnify:CR=1 FL=1